jgi:lysine 2,3-aminomutase
MPPEKLGASRWAGSPALPLRQAAERIGVDWDETARAAARRLPLRFPARYLDLVDPADPEDPIRKIAWPDPEELRFDLDAIADPVGEETRKIDPLVIQKYADRALLLVTSRCHFYCRFCFRAGQAHDPTLSELQRAIERLAQVAGIEELILSGGDPLVLPDQTLRALLLATHRLPELRTVRLHTRAPVHDPDRITPELVETLVSASPVPLRVAMHTTHPRELTSALQRAIELFRARDVALLNQTVLLRGVNAQAELLAEHFDRLHALGVRPYYLHHPDRVAGTARFRLSIEAGLGIYSQLRALLDPQKLPRYVLDPPDGGGKVDVTSLLRTAPGVYRIVRVGGPPTEYHDAAGRG